MLKFYEGIDIVKEIGGVKTAEAARTLDRKSVV